MRYPIVKISRFLLARLEVRRHQRLPFRYLRKGLLMGLVFVLVSAWIFSGFPRIWQNPAIPPEIKIAQAASEGPNSPSTGSTSADSGTVDWTGPGNITASDNSRATASLGKGVVSYYLRATGFGFNIPTGSTINGITVEIERSIAEATSNTRDESVKIIKDGTITGDEKADTGTFWPVNSGDAYATYGGSTDTWGATWTVADINSSNFGVAAQAKNAVPTKPTTETAQVDHIRITVTYTAPSTTFLIGGTEAGTKDTAVTTITFPEGVPEGTVDAPYNDVDGSGDPQVLSPTDSSEPVVKIKNTHASASYNIILEITTWTNSLVDMEYYNLAADGATNIDAVTTALSAANGGANTVSTGVSINAGAYKDLYLKLTLSSVAGKTGTSTLTILGATP